CGNKLCISVMTTDGHVTQFEDDNAMYDEDPVWSPDGTKIAFVADGATVFVMNADGGFALRIGSGMWPAWSPDSQHVAFVGNGGHIDLANANGLGAMVLTDTHADGIDDLAWSPDGQQLAFSGGSGSDNSLYVVNTDGSNLRQLSASITGSPAWSPDG